MIYKNLKLEQSYRELIGSIYSVSEFLLYQGKFDDALRVLNSDILKFIEEKGELKDWLLIQTQLAKVILHKGLLNNSDFNTPRQILLEVKAKVKHLNDKSFSADVEDLYGWSFVYQYLFSSSSYDEALEYFERGLKLREEVADTRGIAESIFHIGILFQKRAEIDPKNQADMDKAFEYYQRAYSLLQNSDYKLEKAYATRHLGFIHRYRRELDKALSYYEQSLALRQEIGLEIFFAPSHHAIGQVYYEMNQLEKALDSYQTACLFAEKVGFFGYLASALLGLGDVQQSQGNQTEALDYYLEAFAVAKSANLDLNLIAAKRRIEKLVNV
jgi:tetratricopeptide (TPR) repeat protein